MSKVIEDLRSDVVYAWDQCEIIFETRYIESMWVEDAYKMKQFPKGWMPIDCNNYTVRFRVVGPPRHTDAATIRAWLNLMAKETA